MRWFGRFGRLCSSLSSAASLRDVLYVFFFLFLLKVGGKWRAKRSSVAALRGGCQQGLVSFISFHLNAELPESKETGQQSRERERGQMEPGGRKIESLIRRCYGRRGLGGAVSVAGGGRRAY